MKKIFVLCLVAYSYCTYAQKNVNIPDPAFKKYLVENPAINTNKDEEIQFSEALAFKGGIDVQSKEIVDMTGLEAFTALISLDCSNNNISSLDVSKNVALTALSCGNNKLTTLDVSKNVALATLYCFNNKLSTLDVSKNVALTTLEYSYNQISTLDVSKNVALTTLNCDGNQLTTLDVSKNVALSTLNCSYNNLSTLDVSKNVALSTLNCSYNNLSTLDVSKNVALSTLNCSYNNLSTLDVSKNVALTTLGCFSNQISTLDVSKNVALTTLNCDGNQLTTLDVSKNVALTALSCGNNKLSTLDVSKNVLLKELNVTSGTIQRLDLSQNTNLTKFICNYNAKLRVINLKNGNNDKLTSFKVKDGIPSLRCLQVDNATKFATKWKGKIPDTQYISENCIQPLESITVKGENGVDKITIVPGGTLQMVAELQPATAFSTVTWDVDNPKIATIHSISGILTAVSDGTVQVTATATDGSNISGSATIIIKKIAIPVGNVNIPDPAFKKYLIENPAINTNRDKEIQFSEAVAFNGEIQVQSKGIVRMTGLEAFTALTSLDCSYNKLSTLDVSKNVALTTLNCDGNQLTTLDVSKNVALSTLNCSYNNLSTLDVSKNVALTTLEYSYNQISTLDVSKNVALTTLNCDGNQLTTLDVSKNVLLKELNVTSGTIQRLDLSQNTNLTKFICNYNAKLRVINLKNGNNDKLKHLDVKDGIPSLRCLQVDNATKFATKWKGKIPDNQYIGENCIPPPLESITVKGENGVDKITIVPGGTLQMVAELQPATAFSTVTWDVDNPKIATIHSISGILTAVSDGTVQVTATATDGSNISGSATIIIKKIAIPVGNVNIPDPAFKKYLIENPAINTNRDKEIQFSEAVAFNGEIQVQSKGIVRMTGLEAFTALTSLDCSYNKLSTLDVSKNVALTTLMCGSNQLTTLDVSKNVALATLYCFNNKLSTLDVSKNVALTTLEYSYNQISTLDVSKNVALTTLNCDGNQLTTLDVSKNVALTTLNCDGNQLTTLDVSKNVLLKELNVTSGTIQRLDLSQNTNLTKFICNYNAKLRVINLKNGNNDKLKHLDVKDGIPSLRCLQVDNATKFATKWKGKIPDNQYIGENCIPPPLESITVKGENGVDKITIVPGGTLQMVAELQPATAFSTVTWDVDNPKIATIHSISGILTAVSDGTVQVTATATDGSNISGSATIIIKKIAIPVGNVNIPDPAFKKYLIENPAINTNRDKEIQFSEAVAFNGEIQVQSKGIVRMTGLEAFTALTSLDCSYNKLSTLDVSKNVALTTLNCDGNQLTTLDVSKNVALSTLNCSYNNLSTLDVSKNVALATLYCFNNKLSTLDVSKNVALTTLEYFYNQISTLDVSKNVALSTLNCSYNNLSTLDVSKNVALSTLNCSYNNLSSLDVSKNVALTALSCGNNKLSTLDVSKNVLLKELNVTSGTIQRLDLSQNTNLTKFICNYNAKLRVINLKNGNNDKLTSFKVKDGIPSLRCLQVDNATKFATKWKGKIPDTQYISENCIQPLESITVKGENGVDKITIVPGGTLQMVAELQPATAFSTVTWDVDNPKIATIHSISGILTAVSDGTVQVTATATDGSNISGSATIIIKKIAIPVGNVNIPDPAFKKYLIENPAINTNRDKEIQFSEAVTFTGKIYVSGGDEKIVDMTGLEAFTALTSLDCSYNKLSTLDVSKNVALTTLNCGSNQLSTLDVSKNVALSTLNCSYNNLSTLDVSKNVALTTLNCDGNQLTTLDVSKNVALTTLYCFNNKLSTLDVSKNVALSTLNCSYNNLSTLDVSKNVALTTLGCFYNQISTLDVSKNVALSTLNCSYNNLSSLDVSKNVALTALSCGNNKLSTLDVSKNVLLKELNVTSGTIQRLDLSQNTNLTKFICNYNAKLRVINLKNGNNDKLTSFKVKDGIPSLRCLQVDNATKFATKWKGKIPDTQYISENCIQPLESITVKGENGVDKITIVPGGTLQMVAELQPATAFSTVTWDVDNPKIATIHSISGILTAVSDGTVQVTATATDGSNISGSATIIIKKIAIPVGNVNIPDPAFKKYLIENPAINTNRDKEIQFSEAVAFNGEIQVQSKGIVRMTGLEAFTALTSLDCSYNKLSTLDVSKNVALTTLNCGSNQLPTLDVSKNVALGTLGCGSNQLPTLDVSKNVALGTLDCAGNNIIALDVSKNVSLNVLYVSSSSIQQLDLSQNTNLTAFICYNSAKLRVINLKNGNNDKLTSFKVKDGIPSLRCLQVDNATKFATKWKGYIPGIQYISENCAKGVVDATQINVKGENGVDKITRVPGGILQMKVEILPTNASFKWVSWSVSDKNIATIDKKGVLSAKADGTVTVRATSIHNNSIYGEKIITIANEFVYIPDKKFENYLVKNSKINTNGDQWIDFSEAENFQGVVDVRNKKIDNLTGIEYFTAITTLKCSGNNLASLDVLRNTNLLELDCSKNKITSLDLTKNTKLTVLRCGDNQLTTINLRNNNNEKLVTFSAKGNKKLRCIQVDNAKNFKGKWSSNVDNPQVIGENCAVLVASISVQGARGINRITKIPGTLQMEYTVKPAKAFMKNVKWSVSDPKIATISSKGLLSALKPGKVVVSAKALDGSDKVGEKEIDISIWVTKIKVSSKGNKVNVAPGEKIKMLKTVFPENATEKSIEWSVNFKGLATIDKDGLLTALAEGEVLAIAKAIDGSKTIGTFKITISNVTGLSNKALDDSNITIYPNPAGNTLKIDHKGLAHQIVIADMTGKIIKTVASENKKTSVIDVSSMESKMYILQIYTKDEVHYRKFIKL